VIEQVLAMTIGMADTMMVASVGEAAVSGISLVDTINQLLISIFSALATGGAVVASQYLGAGDRKEACSAAKQLVYSIAALSAGVMLLSIAGRTHILRLIFGQIEPVVMENAKVYFLLSALSYPFLGIFNAGAALYRAMGNSRASMLVSVLMNLVNISGNAIFIFGFGLGVRGAALATLVSRVLGAVIMLVLIRHPSNPVYVEQLLHFEFRGNLVKNILYIGIPNGLENGLFQAGKILVQSLVATFGTAAIAANAVANNMAGMQVIPGNAMGLALITVVGQCVGAEDYEAAKRYTLKLMKVAYLTMGAWSLLLTFLSPAVARVYHLSPEVTEIAIQLMMLHGICGIVFWPSSFALPNALRAASDVRFTMASSIFSVIVFRLGLSYLLGLGVGLGVQGVWLAMVCDWIFRSLLFVTRFFSGKWRGKRKLA
jgi:putative MATE family efflux protein